MIRKFLLPHMTKGVVVDMVLFSLYAVKRYNMVPCVVIFSFMATEHTGFAQRPL